MEEAARKYKELVDDFLESQRKRDEALNDERKRKLYRCVGDDVGFTTTPKGTHVNRREPEPNSIRARMFRFMQMYTDVLNGCVYYITTLRLHSRRPFYHPALSHPLS